MFKKNLNIAVLASLLSGFVSVANALEIGVAAPSCVLKNFGDGTPIDLAALRGKVVYLDFWASWCGPCLQSMPFMDEMQAQLGAKGLQMLAVNLDEDPSDAKTFLDKHPVKLKIAATEDDSCPTAYQVEAMPSSFLIDRKGNIRHIELGFHKGDSAAIRKRVEQLLSEG